MKKADTVIEQLRQRLHYDRKRRGLTQKDVGEILGLTQTGYGSFERGRTTLRGKQLDQAFELVKQWEQESAANAPDPARTDPATVICDTPCPGCGAVVPGPSQGMAICGRCGENLSRKCAHCNRFTREVHARYCSACGNVLE